MNSKEKLQNQLNFPQKKRFFAEWLSKTLNILNKDDALFYFVFTYATAGYTTNSIFLNVVSVLEKIGLCRAESSQKFTNIIAENIQAFNEFSISFPQRENYRYILEQKIKLPQHQMCCNIGFNMGLLNKSITYSTVLRV